MVKQLERWNLRKSIEIISLLYSSSSNRNQFSIFDRNQGPLKAIQQAPAPTPAPAPAPPPRMPQPPNWNGQPAMPVPPLPPGGSFVSIIQLVEFKKKIQKFIN